MPLATIKILLLHSQEGRGYRGKMIIGTYQKNPFNFSNEIDSRKLVSIEILIKYELVRLI